ncbi:hypothetical protein ACHAXR_013286 [Thalassiosira sp. AJA248-18]
MMPRSIAVAAYATLMALLTLQQGNCFAPPRISSSHGSSISGRKVPASTGSIVQENNAIARENLPLKASSSDIDGPDRALSCLPYLIPLIDGDRYGRFLFYTVPALGMADSLLLGPFKSIYYSIPFGQLIFFIGLSVLSRNPDLSRPLRFNMQQALILDIALIFPSLLGRLPFPMPGVLVNSGSNFVYIAMVASVGYSIVSNLAGKVPDRIPVVSEAAGSSI